MTAQPETVPFDSEYVLEKHAPQGIVETYIRFLSEENKRLNLVSRETSPAELRLLVAESLLPLEHLDRSRFARYLDIGSGGGLPGLPLVLTDQIERAVLLERTDKKCFALERMIKALQLESARIQAVQANFDQWETLEKFDLITLRLVRLTRKLAGKIAGLLGPDGLFVYYSSPPDDITEYFSSFTTCQYLRQTGQAPKTFTILRK